ncbi:MAG: DUF1616 domain-containing protein [archaeon]
MILIRITIISGESIIPKGIDVIERTALSFALSIAVVPLMVFYLNLIGLKIIALNSSLVVLGIVVIAGAVVLFIQKQVSRR